MMHPLDGVRAKIERAEEHIKNLNIEITTFLSQKPPPYEIIGQHQKNGLEYAFVVTKVPQVPLRFAVIAGDVIHNLRSSLDHLLYALIVDNGGTPTTQTQFPICSTVEKFEEACKRGRIKGVSTAAEKLIRSVQPYTSQTPDDTIFFTLDEYNIFDKHRLLVVVTMVARPRQEIVFRDNPEVIAERKNVLIRGELVVPPPRPVTKEGEVIFSIPLKRPAPYMEADADFVPQVAFEKTGRVPFRPVTQILSVMTMAVKHCVSLFDADFN